MANVSSVTNHWITGQEGFTTTLASTISSGATTVPLNSVSGYTNGNQVAFVIEPNEPSKKQVFTGTIDTAGVQVTGVVWTEGTNQTHTAGVTVVDYWTATHQAAMVKGLLVEHNQDGTHDEALITSRTEDTSPDPDADFVLTYDTSATSLKKAKISNLNGSSTGWINDSLPAVSTVTNNGNRSYDIGFASTVASILSPGMRLRTTRTVSASTQCADLEASSSQYFAKASATGFATGTTWTIKARIKPESYGLGVVWALDDGTNVIQMYLNASGQVIIGGGTAAAQDLVTSYQSVVLGKWQDVTASITVGTPTGEIRIDDAVVPSFVTASAATTVTVGTPTVYIGRNSGGIYFDGKIAQVAVFNAVISDATLKTYSSQTMTGSETSCKGFWSLNNTLNDLNASANNLTAFNSAVATNADSPFANATGTPSGTTDVAVVMAVSGSTATVQVPEGCTIPTTGGVSAVAYSTTANPYGWVADKGRWEVLTINRNQGNNTSAPVLSTWYNLTAANISGSFYLTVPIGYWKPSYQVTMQANGANPLTVSVTLSTANNTEIDPKWTSYAESSGTVTSVAAPATREHDVNLSSATAFYLNTRFTTAGATALYNRGDIVSSIIKAIPAGI